MTTGFLSGSSRSVKVKKNILGSLAIKGFSILIQLMLVPLTLGYVSAELYGVWLTLSSVVLWFNFFDIGFTLGLKNKLAEAIAIEDWALGKSLVSTTYIMVSLIFVPLCIILELLTPYIDWCGILHVSSLFAEDIVDSLRVLIACFCLQMIVNVFTSVAQAYQKTALAVSFPTISNAISLIIIYLLTHFCRPSLVYLSYAISVIPIIAVAIASIHFFHNSFQKVAPSLAFFEGRHVRSLFSLGVKFFIIQVQLVVFFQCTNLLISNLSGPEDVSCYNVTYKYLSTGLMLFTIILSPLWPAFTDAHVKQDYDWMKKVYKKMRRVFFLFAIATILMVAVSPIVYRLWIAEKLSIPFSLSLLVGIYMVLNMWYQLHVFIVNGIGCIRIQTYVCLFGLLFHIPFSLLLGHWLSYYSVIYSMILVTGIYSFFISIQVRKILAHEETGIWGQ